jgi:hypothetical protein
MANCSSDPRFSLDKDQTKPGRLMHAVCTVSREEHQCSHDVNGKKYRYESILVRKGEEL